MVLLGYISYYYMLGRIQNRPRYVTELGRRWIHKSVHAKRQTTCRIVSQGIEVVIAHVVIVRSSNHGDQSRNQEGCFPFAIDLTSFKEKEDRCGKHGHEAHEERETSDIPRLEGSHQKGVVWYHKWGFRG